MNVNNYTTSFHSLLYHSYLVLYFLASTNLLLSNILVSVLFLMLSQYLGHNPNLKIWQFTKHGIIMSLPAIPSFIVTAALVEA